MRGIAVHDLSGGWLSVGPGVISSTHGKPTRERERDEGEAVAQGREDRKPRKSQFCGRGVIWHEARRGRRRRRPATLPDRDETRSQRGGEGCVGEPGSTAAGASFSARVGSAFLPPAGRFAPLGGMHRSFSSPQRKESLPSSPRLKVVASRGGRLLAGLTSPPVSKMSEWSDFRSRS